MKITFLGDIMLGRMIGSKYGNIPYQVVSDNIKNQIKDSDLVVANLESPIAVNASTEGDHLQFKGNPDLLSEFDFVNLFSTANNHITDCGEEGVDETVKILDQDKFDHNGVFKKEYVPYTITVGKEKVSIVTLTDMLNIPFDKDSKWRVLRLGDEKVMEYIVDLKRQGYTVILFAHVGMLFTRYPNPITYEYMHSYIDAGADLIVTCHSHCLGGMERYKGKYIFHSLGDFLMDGNSERRRQSGILKIELNNGEFTNWCIIPTETSKEFKVDVLSGAKCDKKLREYNKVSKNIEDHSDCYADYFKKVYRKEILNHSIGTLKFIAKERGVLGLLKQISMRATEVGRTIFWMVSDRSKVQRDDDAIKPDRKKISQDKLFGNK